MDHKEKMAVARMIATAPDRFPYLAAAIYAMIPKWSDQVTDPSGAPTFGVTKDAILWIHPDAIEKWSQGEVAAALVHEAQHLLRNHCSRREGISAQPVLWNLAADLAINHEIVTTIEKFHQPEGQVAQAMSFPKGYGVLPKQFKLPEGLTAEEYYHRLREKMPPKAPQPCCGSGAGNPMPSEPEDGGKGATGRSESELAAMRRETAEAANAHEGKNPGSVPGDLLRWAEQQLLPPKVRWQDKLARACRASLAFRAGVHDFHYGSCSRRQWGVGTGPGRPILPAMRSPIPRVAVAIDTSGSMGQDELLEAMSEVSGLLRAAGAPVDFLACDASVHSLAPIQDWRQAKKLLKGGGGTDFHPIFNALSHRRPRANLVVVMTDGWGPAPTSPPAGMDVVWLLVGSNVTAPATWGTVIRITEAGAETLEKGKAKRAA